jgi:drug/metabolite transporter (DMT)-like permease
MTTASIGISAALAAAGLFGAGTPLAKWLLVGDSPDMAISPWVLAGLLYAGSGVGLALVQLVKVLRAAPRAHRLQLNPGEGKWLAAAVVCGGLIAPVLLMVGLAQLPASTTALLLNAEAVLTAVIAWVVFKENADRRIVLGMAAIVAGALLLSWQPASTGGAGVWPTLAVLLACLFWALDNNFTRKVALADASWIACIKGLAAGATNLTLAWLIGAAWPAAITVAPALLVGFFAYGVSLALFVVGLRHLGAARAGAYFSVAPFVGAAIAVLFLQEPVTWQLLAAAVLMALGLALHLTEKHLHWHAHVAMQHTHVHAHGRSSDGHHTHTHEPAFTGRHAHPHMHEPTQHAHAHYPDAHHRHPHPD